jgi:SlyX protein
MRDLTPSVLSRVDELEIKLSFMDDTIDRLNDVLVRQQRQIDGLLLQLQRLQFAQVETGAGPVFRSLLDELPPHY